MAERRSDNDYFIIWNSIRLVSHAITRLRNEELAQYGITNQQSAMLWMIDRLGSRATPTEIARRLLREPASISNILGRMEKQGLISRVNDIRRYNQVRFKLTEDGRKKYHSAMKRETMRRVVSRLSKRQRRELRVALSAMKDIVLEELGVPENQRALIDPLNV